MSVISGQRIVSIRKRILAYCEQHNVAVPSEFLELDPVYAIALVEIQIPEKPRLIGETFYNEKSVLLYLKDRNKNPENYRFLDFKRGIELQLESGIGLRRGAEFDNRKDIDIKR